MLKAKLDAARKNKKGFSLIELIIVVAIMVALIAVLAPSYVKYVQKSRDSALATAAEDLATATKTFYADPDCQYKPSEGGKITLTTTSGALVLQTSGATISGYDDLLDYAGIEVGKKMGKASFTCTLTITSAGKVTISTAAVTA